MILSPAALRSFRFQSTFPHGERHGTPGIEEDSSPVSIHVPARGTTIYLSKGDFIMMVSIHVPARGTTKLGECLNKCILVSIHVPARGTTGLVNVLIEIDGVSIHVPARGTTYGDDRIIENDYGFNPRSRTGNDRFCQSWRL